MALPVCMSVGGCGEQGREEGFEGGERASSKATHSPPIHHPPSPSPLPPTPLPNQTVFNKALESCDGDFRASMSAGSRSSMPDAVWLAQARDALTQGMCMGMCVFAYVCVSVCKLVVWKLSSSMSPTQYVAQCVAIHHLCSPFLLPPFSSCCRCHSHHHPHSPPPTTITSSGAADPSSLVRDVVPRSLLPKLSRMVDLMLQAEYAPAQEGYVSARSRAIHQVSVMMSVVVEEDEGRRRRRRKRTGDSSSIGAGWSSCGSGGGSGTAGHAQRQFNSN